MLAIATPALLHSGMARGRSPTPRPLDAMVRELTALSQRMAALQQSTRPALRAWRQTLQQVRVQLFLTASQLLPLWRDMCRDTRAVDCAELRLAQLSALTDAALQADEGDPMADARRAVLTEDLRQHRERCTALMRALEAVVERDSLLALADVWAHERERMHRAQRLGRPLAMDNEDADPVGAPPR